MVSSSVPVVGIRPMGRAMASTITVFHTMARRQFTWADSRERTVARAIIRVIM